MQHTVFSKLKIDWLRARSSAVLVAEAMHKFGMDDTLENQLCR